MRVLDLFSAAAGGWTLGLHRAGFETIAACEAVDWRRALYAENNPGIPIYDDVRTLSAARLVSDLGRLPDIIVGSPPCQDISSANTKGKGVHGERSGLFFEAVRLIGECKPRWFALENSANLRTRGADAVLAALEGLGYACWPVVVRASDIGANHERARSWLIGCDLAQVTDADGDGRAAQWSGRWSGFDLCDADDPLDADENQQSPFGGVRAGQSAEHEGSALGHTASFRHEGGRAWRHGPDGNGAAHAGDAAQDGRGQGLSRRHAERASGASEPPCGDAADAARERCPQRAGSDEGQHAGSDGHCAEHGAGDGIARTTPDPDQAGQADGCLESGLRQAKIADDGRGDGRRDDRQGVGQMGLCAGDSRDPDGTWADWSLDDLAGRLRLDDGLPARVAGTRVALGTPKGTSAASLIVEAYGDAVVPQIPEAIGNAILRVEAALSAIYAPRLAA